MVNRVPRCNVARIEVGQGCSDSSSICSSLSAIEETFSGADAQKLLSDHSINDFKAWNNGTFKHLVSLTPDGLIANHALVFKDDETSFHAISYCGLPYVGALACGNYRCVCRANEVFALRLSGPLSLEILEKASGDDLHDLEALEFAPMRIEGVQASFEVACVSSGFEPVYEVRGSLEHGREAFDAVCRVGEPMGMERAVLSDRSICRMPSEYVQMAVDFESSLHQYGEYRASFPYQMNCCGSVDPANTRARFRTPVECDWGWMAEFDHDFVGRQALEAEMLDPMRRHVMLEFDETDLAEVYRSQFTDKPYKFMDTPCSHRQSMGGHQDIVASSDGMIIGVSSCPAFNQRLHSVVSHAVLDLGEAEEGGEVLVRWGEFGERVIDLRAKIVMHPRSHGAPGRRNRDLETDRMSLCASEATR